MHLVAHQPAPRTTQRAAQRRTQPIHNVYTTLKQRLHNLTQRLFQYLPNQGLLTHNSFALRCVARTADEDNKCQAQRSIWRAEFRTIFTKCAHHLRTISAPSPHHLSHHLRTIFAPSQTAVYA